MNVVKIFCALRTMGKCTSRHLFSYGGLRRYIELSRHYLTTFPNTSKFVKNTPLCVVLSTPLSMFGNVVKHGLSCLMCYLKQRRWGVEYIVNITSVTYVHVTRGGSVQCS